MNIVLDHIKERILSLPGLVIILLTVMITMLFFGAYTISVSEVFAAIFEEKQGASNFLILNIRLPRILLAGLIGAGLSVSGAMIQGLFRNPLADQTLIGVTSGAMLFAILSIVFMGSLLVILPAFISQFFVALFAFLGGLLTTFLVYRISRQHGQVQVGTMLLAGIAISAFAAAISGAFIYISDDQQLRDITFWSLGSLSGANWTQLAIAGPIIITGTLLLTRFDKSLNAILLGEQEAAYLGINVGRVKKSIILLTSLIIGICIGISGIIGFIGLIIPHFLRLLKGTDFTYLIKSSALVGAIFLILADTIARTIISPAELPIGILTALIGAPFFLWILVRNRPRKYIL